MLHKNKMADKNIKIIKIINFKVNSTSKESISYDNNKTVKKNSNWPIFEGVIAK